MSSEPLPQRPASLRGQYSPSVSDWTFNSSPGPSSQLPNARAPTAWTTRSPPPKPRVLDLSPYPYDELDIASEEAIDITTLLKLVVGNALLQYASTGIAMPFEVAKVLMQVQWIPRDAVAFVPEEVVYDPDEAESDEQDAVCDF